MSAGLVASPAAGASCIAAVVVEGRLLLGEGSVVAARLPRIGKEHPAVEPACNDAGQNEPDRAISVLTLAGLPPDVAVVRRGARTELYLAEGSLSVSSAHPLHRALYPRTSRRSVRRGTCRRESRVVRGTLTNDTPRTSDWLEVRTGRRTIVVATDERSRLTNRPAYEPLNPGQRLAIRTSVCGSRRVADTIAFDGATVPPERFETDTGGGFDLHPRWIAALVYVAFVLALLLAALRLGRDRR